MSEKLQHKPYIDPVTGETLPMGPDDFGKFYSQYYQDETDDSPDRSRTHLIERLVTGIEEMVHQGRSVRILDMGAGRQVLERELQKNSRFRPLKDKVHIVTLDIARVAQSQLLASQVDHVTADGSQLPFPESAFDIVYSSMAIDFMPKQRTFSEVRRVLKPNGKMFINFHHPDLITITERDLPSLRTKLSAKINTIEQTKKHGRNSSRLEQRLAPLNRDRQELENHIYFIQKFFGQIFPELIFHNTDEIMTFLQEQFPQAFMAVNEFTNMIGSNGWFTADIDFNGYEALKTAV